MKIQNSKGKMQNHRSKFKSLTFFLFFIVIFNFSFLIFHLDKAEASALSLGLDPPIIEIHAIPPSNVESSLIIQNKSDSQVDLNIELKPFHAQSEIGEPQYTKDVPQFFKNIRILDAGVPIERIILNSKQQKTLTLEINLPKEAAQIDYYFSIIFVSKTNTILSSSGSLNQLGIANNVLLSVGAKENPSAAIEEFSAKLFFQKGPVDFTIRVKNMGTHFIKPKGEIIVRNMFGQSIGKLNLAGVNILSDSTRTIPNASWKENFLLGFYTATLNLSLSDNGPAFTKSIVFFALPIQSIIIIAIIILSINLIGNRLRKYRSQSAK